MAHLTLWGEFQWLTLTYLLTSHARISIDSCVWRARRTAVATLRKAGGKRPWTSGAQGAGSASEIVAAALQDNRRATLVGPTKTFGKGRIQNVQRLVGGCSSLLSFQV